jgi:succinate dehydrogenase / fumarate reductase cytochrome b subunit
MPANKNKRPVYLNLVQIRLPVGGVVSILHRVTGVLLVLALPFSLLLLDRSLASADDYQRVANLAASLPGRLLLLAAVAAMAHHLFAGVRHLLLDLDIGIARAGSRLGAWLVLLADSALTVLLAAALFL